jgi:hypothetical protein
MKHLIDWLRSFGKVTLQSSVRLQVQSGGGGRWCGPGREE